LIRLEGSGIFLDNGCLASSILVREGKQEIVFSPIECFAKRRTKNTSILKNYQMGQFFFRPVRDTSAEKE
jgi:hypothetical protein